MAESAIVHALRQYYIIGQLKSSKIGLQTDSQALWVLEGIRDGHFLTGKVHWNDCDHHQRSSQPRVALRSRRLARLAWITHNA